MRRLPARLTLLLAAAAAAAANPRSNISKFYVLFSNHFDAG